LEQRFPKPKVGGSTPLGTANFRGFLHLAKSFGSFLALLPLGRYAQLPTTMRDKIFLHALESIEWAT